MTNARKLSTKLQSQNVQINEQYLMSIFTKVKSLKEVPTQESPVFVIKYGPPASGKGSTHVKNVIARFGKSEKSYIDINVDDIVESLESYKTDSRKTLMNKGITQYTPFKNIDELLNQTTNNNAKKYLKPYIDIRSRDNMKKLNKNKMTLVDRLIQKAIKGKKNIILETSGVSGFPFWIFSVFKGLDFYNIHFVFPLIEMNEGWKRYKKRAIDSFLRGGVFRFGLSKEKYKEFYINSYNKFMAGKEILKKLEKIKNNVNFHVISKGKVLEPGNQTSTIKQYLENANKS